MFSNLNWWNIVVLLLLALFIFGDKLPQVIGDGLRMLRNLRRMARSATTDLSRELGTDIQLEDLHPKAFIRKHILSEADQEAIVKPLKGLSDDLREQTRGLEREFSDLGKDLGKQAEQIPGDVRQAADPRGVRSRPDSAAGAAGAAGGISTTPAMPAEPGPGAATSYDDIT